MGTEGYQAEEEIGQAISDIYINITLKEDIMAKKREEKFDRSGFPKLTRADMDMIASAMSYCLSDQYGEDIVFKFIPKTAEEAV